MEAVCGALDPYLLSLSLTGSPTQLPRRAAVSEVAACPRPPAQPARLASLHLCLRRAGEQLCPSRATLVWQPRAPRGPACPVARTAVPAACSVCPHLGTARLRQPRLPGLQPCRQPPGAACAAQPGQRRDAPVLALLSYFVPQFQLPDQGLQFSREFFHKWN